MIVCVAPNPSIDKLFEVERITPGQIHRPLRFLQVPGGKGFNVARAAASLGAEVRASGLLAGHAGRWTDEALTAEGVTGRFGWMDGETRSSLSVADRATGGLTEFYEAGPAVTPQAWASLEAAVASVLPGAAWMTLSGSIPPKAPRDGLARLVKMAKEHDTRVAVDARGPELAHALDASPDLVKLNAAEVAALLGCAVPSDKPSAVDAALELRDRAGAVGARIAVVTLGAKGAVLAGPGRERWVGSVDALGAYPVGSGDAFLAGMVVALETGASPKEAFALALGAGAANAELPGAGRLDPARARELGARAVIEPAHRSR